MKYSVRSLYIIKKYRSTGTNSWVELGAQWIHGQGHSIYTYAQQNGFVHPYLTSADYDSEMGDWFFDTGRYVRKYFLNYVV